MVFRELGDMVRKGLSFSRGFWRKVLVFIL